MKKRAYQVRELDEDTLYKVLMAGAYALKRDLPKYMGHTESPLDIKDLSRYLNYDVKSIYDPITKRFRKLKHGLKFLDVLTRKYYTNVLDHHKGALEDTYNNLFEVCTISLHLATPKTVMNTRRYFSTYTHASTKNRLQFASNFNPLISAYLFQEYGLKSSRRKEIILHSSSEGWLGRMLSSFYVAYNNPDYNVKYYSIDPNIKVVESFYKLREILTKDYQLTNWKAEILHQGSEEFYKLKEKIDISFTSPPYLDLEKYPDTYLFKLEKGLDLKVSSIDSIEGVLPKDIRIGDTIQGKRVEDIQITKQASTLYKTKHRWNELFLRPTIQNIKNNSKKGSYLIWNVTNIKNHNSMVEDSIRIIEEVGYKHINTLKYPLIRKPASSGKKDEKGNNIRLANVKENYEPILVFKQI